MSKSITFRGSPGGDCECFCWFVTEEEYRRIVGEKIYKIDIDTFKESEKSAREAIKKSPELLKPRNHWDLDINWKKYHQWKLYPGDIINAMGIEDEDSLGEKTFKLEILE